MGKKKNVSFAPLPVLGEIKVGGGNLTNLIDKSQETDCIGTCDVPNITKILEEFYKSLTGKSGSVRDLKAHLKVKGVSCIIRHPQFAAFLEKHPQHKKPVADFAALRLKNSGPRNTNEWLSNDDIDGYFKKLETQYPKFKAIPYQMIDFPTQVHHQSKQITQLDFLKEYDQGKRYFGAAINTDVSSGTGIHWFAFFVDLSSKPCTIEFFDSTGNPMDSTVREWAMKLQQKLASRMPCNIIENRQQHQHENSECGVYTSFYIFARLSGMSFKDFQKEKINDARIAEFRKGLFSSC